MNSIRIKSRISRIAAAPICFAMLLFLFLLFPGLVASAEIDERFIKFDRDKDGRLSREETPQAFRKFKFDLADRNKDSFLDVEEFEWVRGRLVEKKRRALVSSVNPVVPETGQMHVIRDVIYREETEDVDNPNGKLDLYVPLGKERFSVVFWIHGGGLHSGDKSKIADVAGRFIAEGYGFVSANYRLYPEVKHPTQIEDVASAFAWVHRNIAQYGGDPQLIFVAGGSAGGHLAALLSLNEEFLENHGLSSLAIRGTIPISGLMDVRRVGTARRNSVWGDNPITHRTASPLHHARKDAPPMLLLHAEHDTLDRRQQNQAMFDAMKKSGHSSVAIYELEDRTHNNIRTHLVGRDDPGAQHILNFIRLHTALK